MEFTDYYRSLDTSPHASGEIIKRAYHKLALKYHPDMGGSPLKMSQINEAYSVLSNEMLKANYDSIYQQFYSQVARNSQDIERMNALVQLLVVAKKSASAYAYRGAGWFVVGMIVTAVSYAVASPGGYFVLAAGALIFGGYQFIVGMHYYFNPQLLIKKRIGAAAYNRMFKDVAPKTSWKIAWVVIAVAIVGLVAIGATTPNPDNTSSGYGSYTSGSSTN